MSTMLTYSETARCTLPDLTVVWTPVLTDFSFPVDLLYFNACANSSACRVKAPIYVREFFVQMHSLCSKPWVVSYRMEI